MNLKNAFSKAAKSMSKNADDAVKKTVKDTAKSINFSEGFEDTLNQTIKANMKKGMDIEDAQTAAFEHLKKGKYSDDVIKKMKQNKETSERIRKGAEEAASDVSQKAKKAKADAAFGDKVVDKTDKALRAVVPAAIGGGLIFSMFDRGGQMTNNELYGQSRPYGY